MNEYKIYALKYAGPAESSGALLMWLKDWEKTVKRSHYLWCLKGPEETIVVDAGTSPEMALERNLIGYISPAEVLSRMGVKSDEVRHVFLTHMHWDHMGGVRLFPKATFYVQESEYSFWLKGPLIRRPVIKPFIDEAASSYLASLEGSPRLVFLRGDQEVLPGIQCLYAPGHTVGLQAVAVNTARGTAILGSDCAHLFRNYREDWPSAFIFNLADWLRSYEKLRSRVSTLDLLFPGHDPLMSTNYREVAEGVTELV
jgi:glyoxylase-like metal-dependent hydrolase (beta-lactamase superfamily II)